MTTLGELLWAEMGGGAFEAGATFSADGNTTYIGDLGGYLWAVDTVTGSLRWFFQVNAPIYTTPAVSPTDGVVYVVVVSSIVVFNESQSNF